MRLLTNDLRQFFPAVLAVLAGGFAACGALAAEEIPPKQREFFENKIRPVLVRECYQCHAEGAKEIKGSLRLDTRAALLQGGDSGPAVVAGSPDDSPLIQALRHESFQMPPNKQLPDAVIADFVRWVELGAPDPRDGDATIVKKEIDWDTARQYWAFQPPRDASPPRVRQAAWPRDTVDRFVLARLEAAGLRPAPDADSRVWLRRVYFDLLGLPPAPEAVAAFVASDTPAARQAVVEALLDSPQFGERWGRHWLDVARYGESNGRDRNILYPQAWRYRDWVIAAVNADQPYDQFIREQVAGDLLPTDDPRQRAARLIATGFLAIGPKQLNERDPNVFRMDMIDEQIDALTRAVLGLTVACARCHDHKFDPIPTADYYSLAGVFRSSAMHYGGEGEQGNRNPTKLLAIGPEDPSQAAALKQRQTRLAELRQAIAPLDKQITQLEAAAKKAEAAAVEVKPMAVQRLAAAREQVAPLKAELAELQAQPPAAVQRFAMAAQEGKVEDCRIHLRGEVDQLGDVAPRGVPRIVSLGREVKLPANASGRLEVAEWLTDPANPLTARVAVNRIWQHLFGRGLVATSDNFGEMGERPTHPELLDHLAVRFVRDGWSTKQLIQSLVLSRSYAQSSRFDAAGYERDPENTLLWRMSPRRLDAEAQRDAVLAVAGRLDLSPPAGSPVAEAGGGTYGQGRAAFNTEAIVHRSIYLPIIRNAPPEELALFDFAEPSLVTPQRQQTTVPAQALYLLNSKWMSEQSAALASRLLDDNSLADTAARIDRSYWLALSRPAEGVERDRGVRLVELLERGGAEPAAALAAWCQALLASGEFRSVE